MKIEKIKELIAEHLGVEVDELEAGTSLKDDLNADSLDLFQIVMSLEEEYNIEIPTEDVENILTVGDIQRYINDKI